MKKKSNPQRSALIALVVFLSIIALLLGILVTGIVYFDGFIDLLLSNGGNTDSTVETMLTLPTEPTLGPDDTSPTLPSQKPTLPEIPANPIEVEDVINIMLMGTDDKDGGIRGRSDSMILCTIKVKEKTVCMTSFHRDTWVTIPGWKEGKINSAYAHGGFPLFKETMEYNFGLKIDHFLLVEIERFAQIINILGGVDIELTQREVDHLREGYAWDLPAGVNRLDGQKALAYSRIRAIDSNWQRNERQKNLIRSVFQAYKSKPVNELLAMTADILPLILTYDLEKQEVYDLVFTLAPMFGGLTFENYSFPKSGTYYDGKRDGVWMVEITDMDANREYLAEIIGG